AQATAAAFGDEALPADLLDIPTEAKTILVVADDLEESHNVAALRIKDAVDPRKLPLIIAPFHAVPLLIDRARHAHFEDLVIRGGGYDAVDIRHGEHLVFENVTIYAAAYGLRARNTGPMKLHNSAIYGSVPPWSTRSETSLKERPWKSKGRNLTRLNTHALIIPAAGDEYSVYYFPYNHLWEISYCEFADAHDGVYTGDIDGLKFHHNYVHNFQDDGVYLSSFRKLYYPQHGPRQFYQNVISGCIMSFAFGGDARLSSDVHVYRNILDASAVVADHGGPPWESMRWYHNTILANPRFILSSRTGGRPWQVFNNLLLMGKTTSGKPQEGAEWGGNFAGDPNFAKPADFRLPSGSPAIDAGVPLPSDWSDPSREHEKGKPDAGAIPSGGDRLKVGRNGRLSF
ncbi:MAG: right-handed parallel beta-helix repeat-containing protein, partial [Planctomycetes bacterium]|nr:right-handed parallel beta-helix repeat-containing protein [Planctomycetota bacterium]